MTVKKDSIIGLSILLMIIFVTIGMVLIRNNKLNTGKANVSKTAEKKQYVCSMHPQVIADKPGDCPICAMSLIEKIATDKNASNPELNNVVLPVNESILGSSSTTTPSVEDLPVSIEASGIINYDSRKIITISARYDGLVERSFVKSQFQPVRKGEKIYEIYCPSIYVEKWNYVKLLQTYADQDNLTVEARTWFSLLGLTQGQIDSLKRSTEPNYHLPVYSEADGYAVSVDFDPEKNSGSGSDFEPSPVNFQEIGRNIGFNDGVTVLKGTPLFKLIDNKTLRVDLKVRTDDAWLLRKGQKIILSDAATPSKKFETTISLIEPFSGGLFQIVKGYMTDKEGLLFPGRKINAEIMAGNRKALWLPISAVVNVGQKQYAFVMGDNKFSATAVKTGFRSGNKIEILSGIDENSIIALKASLLIDSDGFIISGM